VFLQVINEINLVLVGVIFLFLLFSRRYEPALRLWLLCTVGCWLVLFAAVELVLHVVAIHFSLRLVQIATLAALVFMIFSTSRYLLANRLDIPSWIYPVLAFSIVMAALALVRPLPFFSVDSSLNLYLVDSAGKYFVAYLLVLMAILAGHFNTILSLVRFQRKTFLEWLFYYAPFFVLFAGFFIGAFLLVYHTLPHIYLVIFENIVLIACVLFLSVGFRNTLLGVTIGRPKDVTYSIRTFFYIGLYFLGLAVLSQILALWGSDLGIFLGYAAIGALIIGCLFVIFSRRVRQSIRRFVKAAVFREHIDYPAIWEEFTERVSFSTDLSNLLSSIATFIRERLKAGRVSFLLASKNNPELLVRYENPAELKGSSVFYLKREILERLKKDTRPFYPSDADSNRLWNNTWEEFCAGRNSLLCPLVYRECFLGIMICEFGNNEYRPSTQELNLLYQLSKVTGTVIKNYQYHMELLYSREIRSFSKIFAFLVHDIKGILSRLTLLAENVKTRIQDPEFQKDLKKILDDSISRMRNLTDQIQNSKTGVHLELSKVLIEDVLLEAVQLVCRTSNREIELKKVFQEESRPISVDREKIKAVFMNLLMNAVEAMQEGGELTIGTEYGDHICRVVIRDEGHGISREFLENRLFQPFATTKSRGLGIGLYECKEIVEAHGGIIQVHSEEGKGTLVECILPAAT
jgi:hypothetical protein